MGVKLKKIKISDTDKVIKSHSHTVKTGVQPWIKICSIISWSLTFLISLFFIVNFNLLSISSSTLLIVYGILNILPLVFGIIWIVKTPKNIVAISVFIASALSFIIGLFAILATTNLSAFASGNFLLGFAVAIYYGVLPLFLSCGLVLPSLIGLIQK